MKESFLIHLLIASCGLVHGDTGSSETQNPATIGDESVHKSRHFYEGDKEGVLGNSSLQQVNDKSDKGLLNETDLPGSEIWTELSQSVTIVGTEGPVEVSSDDDTTTTTSESPVEETTTTTDPPETSETTTTTYLSEPTTDHTTSSTTAEQSSTTGDDTTPIETTTTMDPDKGE